MSRKIHRTDILKGKDLPYVSLDVGQRVTIAFLKWYLRYLRKYEPYAIDTINAIEKVIEGIPESMFDTMNRVIREDRNEKKED